MFRVLILDDDPLFGKTLERSLRRNSELPCDVVAVTTDAAACESVQHARLPFDVLLIDQRLGPGPDGITVLQELLRLSPSSSAIVFTTNDPDAGMQAYRAGAYRYLHKPFGPQELILILRSLREWRETRTERDGLLVLAEIAEVAQRALTLSDLGNVVVQGGCRFGFERARLWQLDESGITMIGLSQHGNHGGLDITDLRVRTSDSPYASRAVVSRVPLIFKGQEHGPNYLHQHYVGKGFLAPDGEWATLPLWVGDRCLGLLMLDNHAQQPHDHPHRIRSEQLMELTLLGQQVAAALERVQLLDQERRTNRELEVLAAIGRRVSNRAAIVSLDTLLTDVHSLLAARMDVSNFFIALRDDQLNQIHLRLNVHDNKLIPQRSYPRKRSLMSYVITQNEPIFLPTQQAFHAFRERHAVRYSRFGFAAHCWLGVPLQVENTAIGAMVVQHATCDHAYTEEDQRFLLAVAGQVAGAIQTARLKEIANRSAQRLKVLQRVGEELMRLAEQNEEWLWHAALTIITANYGLGFNRAMLFLAESGGTRLRGRMGIGQFDGRRARARWKADVHRNMSFDMYLQALRQNKPAMTDVDQVVRDLVLHVHDDRNPLAIALREQRLILVARNTAAQCLPTFAQQFGAHEYAVLPLLAGDKRLGVIIVDNAHNREPLDAMPVRELETMLAQVALVYENVRQRRASDQLIEVGHRVLAHVAHQSLKDTLHLICTTTQVITDADCVVIYPLVHNADPADPHYDLENTGSIGLKQPFQARAKPSAFGVARDVLHSGKPLGVPDVETFLWRGQKLHVSDTFLGRERVRAFLAAPINDVLTGDHLGILFLDYGSPQNFSAQDNLRAQGLAELAGAAIRASRARERELEILRTVMETALLPGVNRNQVAHALLRAACDLLNVNTWQVGLVLREWNWLGDRTHQPDEVRIQYFLRSDGKLGERTGQRLYRGITGQAFEKGQDQRVADVALEPLFRPREMDIIVDELRPTRSELDVLIKLEEHQILGLFNIESPDVGAFTEDHHQTLRRLAAAAALALDNVRRQQNLRSVLDVAQSVIIASDVNTTLQAILAAARKLAPGVSAVTIWYKDPESGQIIPGPQFGVRDDAHMRRDGLDTDTVLTKVIQARKPIWEATLDAESPLHLKFAPREQILSVAAFSLRVGDGTTTEEVVGALFFNYRQHHEFTREERVLFPILATIAAANVRDALRLEQMRKERERLDAVKEITEAVGATLKLDETLRHTMQTLRKLFPKAHPCVLTYNSVHQSLEFHPASLEFYMIEFPERVQSLEVYGERSIACQVARKAIDTHQLAWVNLGNARADPHYLESHSKTESELCLALMGVDTLHEELLGVLVLESTLSNAFSDDDVALVRGIGPAISTALDRAYRSADLRFQSSVAAASAWVHEIAHDINKEVSAIRHQAYLLKQIGDKQIANASIQPYVSKIDESADRLAAYARAPRSTEAAILDLSDWLPATITAIVTQSGRSPAVTYVYEQSEAVPRVTVSPVLLERTLRHLLRNALEAMGEQGQLTIRVRSKGSFAEVQIANTGPDIPPDVRPRLFIEQVTTRRVEHSGAEGGLGLLFVRWAVKTMGGDVYLLSKPGETVTFAFTLPIVAPHTTRKDRRNDC